MLTFSFEILLQETDIPDEEMVDLLYEAGCDDTTIYCDRGQTIIIFDRTADSLIEALGSAVEQIVSTGLNIASVRAPQ